MRTAMGYQFSGNSSHRVLCLGSYPATACERIDLVQLDLKCFLLMVHA